MIVGKAIASLPLQMLLWIDSWYSWAYLFLQLSLCLYRGYTFTYSKLIIGFEVLGVFLLVFVQYIRLFIGSVGNKTEEIVPLLYMTLLTIPSVLGSIYYLALQTYVLYADIIINIIWVVLAGLELIFTLFAIIRFKGAEKNQ